MPAVQLLLFCVLIAAWIVWWRSTPHRRGDKIALGAFTLAIAALVAAPPLMTLFQHRPLPAGCTSNGISTACRSRAIPLRSNRTGLANPSPSAPAAVTAAGCRVSPTARIRVQGPPGITEVAPVPPGGNGAPQLSFRIRVTVEDQRGRPLTCLNASSGRRNTRTGTWAAAGPLRVEDAPYQVLNACQESAHPSCRWMDHGVSVWIITGPYLAPPKPITVRLATTGAPVLVQVAVYTQIGPPAKGVSRPPVATGQPSKPTPYRPPAAVAPVAIYGAWRTYLGHPHRTWMAPLEVKDVPGPVSGTDSVSFRVGEAIRVAVDVSNVGTATLPPPSGACPPGQPCTYHVSIPTTPLTLVKPLVLEVEILRMQPAGRSFRDQAVWAGSLPTLTLSASQGALWAGMSFSFLWDQRDAAGVQVPAGRYELKVLPAKAEWHRGDVTGTETVGSPVSLFTIDG